MFALPNTEVSHGMWINQRHLPIPAMSQPNGLSDLQERTLLAVWKLGGIGKNVVDSSKLQTELTNEPLGKLEAAIQSLHELGFLEKTMAEDRASYSLTPLGLAILTKIEEDKLQELK